MASLTMASKTVPGLIQAGNIDLAARPVVKNPDGTISTVRSMSFNEDGREILVPTVSPDGKILSNQQAIDLFHSTGQNLGTFDTPDAATQYAQTLHNQQADMYAAPSEKKTITINIEGRRVKVDSGFLSLPPDQQAATVDEIAKSIGVQAKTATDQSQTQGQEPSPAMQDFQSGMHQDLQKFLSSNDGVLRNTDSFVRGAADTATFGTADELSGLASATSKNMNPMQQSGMVDKVQAALNIANPAGALVKTVGDYFTKDTSDAGRAIREQRAFQVQRDDQDPYASTAGRVAGALTGAVGLTKAGAPLMASLPADASLLAKTAQSAKAGALYSGLYGVGSGTDLKDRAEQGTTAALTGAAIGAAIPGVSSVVAAATKPVRDAVRGYFRPETFANQKIAERLSAAGLDPDQAAAKMARSPGLSLADVGGKTTQNLLKSTTNIPGPAQARVATQLAQKAMLQGDRIKGIVKDVFADPDGFITAGDKLSKQWSKIGNEVYEPALAKPVVWTDRLKQFVDEPIFQRSLAQGVKIQRLESLAENKPFNPQDYAIVGFNEAGDPIVGGVPNMRTLNVAKKGLDAIIGEMKNPLTGKLTEEGRATDMVRRAFLKEIDQWNPEYQAARGVWGGFAKVKEAMQFGQNEAFRLSPEAVAKTFKDMSASEQQAARIGLADALRREIDAAGFTHNAVLKIIGTRQKYGVLKAAFPDQESFAEFRQAMFAEARKRSTYNTVTGNSSTAKQMADLMDAGGLQDTVNFAKDAATGGIASATLRFVGSRLKILGGFTPQVADNVARKLMATNPQQAKAITQELARIEQAAISADQKRQLVYKLITPAMSDEMQTTRAQ